MELKKAVNIVRGIFKVTSNGEISLRADDKNSITEIKIFTDYATLDYYGEIKKVLDRYGIVGEIDEDRNIVVSGKEEKEAMEA